MQLLTDVSDTEAVEMLGVNWANSTLEKCLFHPNVYDPIEIIIALH